MSNTPSDAEIEKLAAEHLKAFAQFSGAGDVWVEGEVAFARAVLAKWGTPQPAPAPLSDDTKRLDWMGKDAGERVFHVGANWYTRPTYGQPYRKHKNLRAAIDAAIAAQGGKA